MDKTVKFAIIVLLSMVFMGSILVACALDISADDNVALATEENSVFTVIGRPPGTDGVIVYMFTQRDIKSITYTCFLVVGKTSVDIHCP